MDSRDSLLIAQFSHQATLIGHAYLTLVWLWEKQPVHFVDVIPDVQLESADAPWSMLSKTMLLWEEGLPSTVSAYATPLGASRSKCTEPWARVVQPD